MKFLALAVLSAVFLSACGKKADNSGLQKQTEKNTQLYTQLTKSLNSYEAILKTLNQKVALFGENFTGLDTQIYPSYLSCRSELNLKLIKEAAAVKKLKSLAEKAKFTSSDTELILAQKNQSLYNYVYELQSMIPVAEAEFSHSIALIRKYHFFGHAHFNSLDAVESFIKNLVSFEDIEKSITVSIP
jgi:hypothetical protein